MPDRPDLMQDRPFTPALDPTERVQRIQVTLDLGLAKGTVADVGHLAQAVARRVQATAPTTTVSVVGLRLDDGDGFVIDLDGDLLPR